MSKRRATTSVSDASNDNEEQPEEFGIFQKANDEVLRSRVIKTAKRHMVGHSDGTTRASPFSGFTGFGKTDSASGASPFSFLSQKPKPAAATSENAGDKRADGEVDFPSKRSDSQAPNAFAAGSSIFNSLQQKSNNNSLNISFNAVEKGAKLPDGTAAKSALDSVSNKGDADKKSQNLENLKELNLSCNSWITEHLQKNPYCILTPIFRDYEKHLAQLDIETESEKGKKKKEEENTFQIPVPNTGILGAFNETTKSFSFGKELTETSKDDKDKASEFKFDKGLLKKPGESTTFPFGEVKNAFPITGLFQPPASTINPILGGGKQSEGDDAEEDESNEPPKSDFLPVMEEDSVYDKRCKIFVKKDSNFTSKGVGTLFLKPVKNTKKTQLIVRADTSSGNILLNIILTPSMPVQKTGKNNAMIVCVPNPETDPSPVPVLIRVKTSEDCDELIQKLEEFKGSKA